MPSRDGLTLDEIKAVVLGLDEKIADTEAELERRRTVGIGELEKFLALCRRERKECVARGAQLFFAPAEEPEEDEEVAG